jgi:hypothetical protein
MDVKQNLFQPEKIDIRFTKKFSRNASFSVAITKHSSSKMLPFDFLHHFIQTVNLKWQKFETFQAQSF